MHVLQKIANIPSNVPGRSKDVERLWEAVVVNQAGVDGEETHQKDDVTTAEECSEDLRVDKKTEDQHQDVKLLQHQRPFRKSHAVESQNFKHAKFVSLKDGKMHQIWASGLQHINT